MVKLILHTIFFLFVSNYTFVSYAYMPAKNYLKKLRKQINILQATEADSIAAQQYFIDAHTAMVVEEPNKALKKLQKALALQPCNAAIHYSLAQALCIYPDEDNTTANLAYIHAYVATELDPTQVDYYYTAIELAMSQDDYLQAAKLYAKMFRYSKPIQDDWLNLAYCFVCIKSYRKAQRIYDKLIKIYGITPDLIHKKQAVFLKQNKLYKAIRESKRLIHHVPSNIEHVWHMIELWTSNAHLKKATILLKQLIQQHPNNKHALLRLCNIYFYQKKYDNFILYAHKWIKNIDNTYSAKIDILNAYITYLKQNVNSPSKLADIIQTKIYPLALNLITQYPSEAKVQVFCGDILYYLPNKKVYSSALKHYKKALALDNSKYAIWQHTMKLMFCINQDSLLCYATKMNQLFPSAPLTFLYQSLGFYSQHQYEDAIVIAKKGKAACDSTLLYHFDDVISNCYLKQKDYAQAKKYGALAYESNKTDPVLMNNYIYILAKSKDSLNFAKKLATQLIDQVPDNPYYFDTYAWVCYQLGDYNTAKNYLEKAIELYKKKDNNFFSKEIDENFFGVLYEHYGDVLYQLGYKEEAVIQWKKAYDRSIDVGKLYKKIKDKVLYE